MASETRTRPFSTEPVRKPPIDMPTRGSASNPSIDSRRNRSRISGAYSSFTPPTGAGHLMYVGNQTLSLPDYNETMAKAKDLEERLERTEQQLRLFQKVSRFMVRDM